jgi:potassium voltage-gated channel Shaker-related subfamily A protein
MAPLHTLPVKKQVWILMSDPNSSRAAQLIATVVMLVIILSCVAMVVQTLPEYVNSKSPAWSSLEYFCTSVFILELGLRLWSSPDKLSFLRQPLNIVDILAILPVFLELMISSNSSSGSAIIRIVRLVRIFRVFKITRYLPWVRVFTNALTQSAQPLFMLLLIFFIAMVLFSSAIYYAEKGEWSDALGAWVRTMPSGVVEVSPYQSIIASFWWCVVTMTTVGYGDNVPITPVGRLVAAVASMSGILVLAIPVSIISTNFNSEFAKLLRSKEQVKARMHLLKKHFR